MTPDFSEPQRFLIQILLRTETNNCEEELRRWLSMQKSPARTEALEFWRERIGIIAGALTILEAPQGAAQ